jgi:CBS domain-containing protein
MACSVDEIMNRELFTVSEDETVGRAKAYMVELGIRAAPVVDARGTVRGFVSLSDLQVVPPEHHVHLCMSAPAETISPATDIETAGRLMAQRDRHHLVCVDDDGRVMGFVGSLDVLRGLLGEPIRHPEVFPHRDGQTQLRWSDEAWLNPEGLEQAPDGPGVFALVAGSPGAPDRVVWSEACWNVRSRLRDLLAGGGDPPPHVRVPLQRGGLRFRAAAAPSSRALSSASSAVDSPRASDRSTP